MIFVWFEEDESVFFVVVMLSMFYSVLRVFWKLDMCVKYRGWIIGRFSFF